MDKKAITVENIIKAPISKAWEFWNKPEHIRKWAFASDDWEAPEAENDLKEGGRFRTKMAAKDGSESFDFGGTYTAVQEHKLIEYDMDESLSIGSTEGKKRHVKVEFAEVPEGVKVIETFDPENVNTEEVQRGGWQAILNNFKKYAESAS